MTCNGELFSWRGTDGFAHRISEKNRSRACRARGPRTFTEAEAASDEEIWALRHLPRNAFLSLRAIMDSSGRARLRAARVAKSGGLVAPYGTFPERVPGLAVRNVPVPSSAQVAVNAPMHVHALTNHLSHRLGRKITIHKKSRKSVWDK